MIFLSLVSWLNADFVLDIKIWQPSVYPRIGIKILPEYEWDRAVYCTNNMNNISTIIFNKKTLIT